MPQTFHENGCPYLTGMTESEQSPLVGARLQVERLRLALETAKKRASETEQARVAAEGAHAELVANALIEGAKTPAKPASLSSLQSADDAADAALAILESRLSQVAGELRQQAHVAAVEIARAAAIENAKLANEGYETLLRGFAKLNEACGIQHARQLAGDLLSWGLWPDVPLQKAVEQVHRAAPEVSDAGQLVSIVFGEHANKMPQFIHRDHEAFAALVASITEKV